MNYYAWVEDDIVVEILPEPEGKEIKDMVTPQVFEKLIMCTPTTEKGEYFSVDNITR